MCVRVCGYMCAETVSVKVYDWCLTISGTNDAYVTIQLGKEKYQTSVKERSDNPEWHEECDL